MDTIGFDTSKFPKQGSHSEQRMGQLERSASFDERSNPDNLKNPVNPDSDNLELISYNPLNQQPTTDNQEH